MSEYRIEHDSMGEVRVPAGAKWRAQTQRAVENFPISGQRIERAHIEALARIERAHIEALARITAAAAKVNAELGVLDKDTAEAIQEAAAEVAKGRWDEQFPVDVFQTGSGTSSNMNTNEVIATLAAERLGRDVHPNDHVNASQSSNDVFPSSIHIAATAAVTGDLIPALTRLAEPLEAKAAEFAGVVKAGRTHLMDATPVTLGQEFGGYAAQVRYGVERLRASLPRLAELPLGGTAVGTGINTPAGFPAAVIAEVARTTGLPLTEGARAVGAGTGHPRAAPCRYGLADHRGKRERPPRVFFGRRALQQVRECFGDLLHGRGIHGRTRTPTGDLFHHAAQRRNRPVVPGRRLHHRSVALAAVHPVALPQLSDGGPHGDPGPPCRGHQHRLAGKELPGANSPQAMRCSSRSASCR